MPSLAEHANLHAKRAKRLDEPVEVFVGNFVENFVESRMVDKVYDKDSDKGASAANTLKRYTDTSVSNLAVAPSKCQCPAQMSGDPFNSEGRGGPAAVFATTRWSVVLNAGDSQGDEHVRALDALCRAYWYPLYAYIRRLGRSPHDAQDLTQSFFAYLLEKRLLTKADPESGRFRSFLLGSLKNFMANEWRRQNAQKRGAGQTISFDAQDAEERYAVEPVNVENPQSIYEQAWAVAVLDQAMTRLETEYVGAGKQAQFEKLAPSLQGDRQDSTYAELGRELAMSEGAVKVAVHRLRQRYRELLRASVADTVADPLEVDGELSHLMEVLSR